MIFGISIMCLWSELKLLMIVFIYMGVWCIKSLSEEGGFRKLRVFMIFIDCFLVCFYFLLFFGYVDG